ncbi:MAG: ComEC family competence protein [Endomicrobium sp.]|jgi:competence protein ComEC|nr:ComEC family competence protein [Endomicrobium sp.]
MKKLLCITGIALFALHSGRIPSIIVSKIVHSSRTKIMMINEKRNSRICNCQIIKILCKRPAITIFIGYVSLLILLDIFGYFSYENQSSLYNLVKNDDIVSIEGKVISAWHNVKHKKRFVLKTSTVNGKIINEKIIVNLPSVYCVSYGDIVKVEGKLKKPFSADFPSTFDYQKYLARNKIYITLDTFSFEYIKSKPSIIKKFAVIFQLDISNKIDTYLKKPCSDILKSLIIGDKSSLATDIKNTFSDSGVMHVLVVSGLHIGFIGIIVLFVLKLTGLSLKRASLLSIPFIFFYAIATGANPPALRSAIMFSCIIFSLALDREPLIYNSLALSALATLIFQPQQLFTASFQMSYGATIGIVCFYKHILRFFENIKNKPLRFICSVLSITISAQIILVPICMYYFGKISVVSLVANTVIVPLIGLVLYLGVIFYVLTFILQYAATLCSIILCIFLNFILSVTMFLGNLKFASINIAKPSITQLLLFFLFLFCIACFKNRKRIVVSGIVLILNLGYLICPMLYEKNKIFFNVYNGINITTLLVRNNSKSTLFLYNKTKYYDKYYINSFKQFILFSGIKKPNIKVAGLDKKKILYDLANFKVDVIESTGDALKEIFDFYFDDYLIHIDFHKNKLYINNTEFSLKNSSSFCFSTKRQEKKS